MADRTPSWGVAVACLALVAVLLVAVWLVPRTTRAQAPAVDPYQVLVEVRGIRQALEQLHEDAQRWERRRCP